MSENSGGGVEEAGSAVVKVPTDKSSWVDHIRVSEVRGRLGQRRVVRFT